jgi:hypothetical protein
MIKAQKIYAIIQEQADPDYDRKVLLGVTNEETAKKIVEQFYRLTRLLVYIDTPDAEVDHLKEQIKKNYGDIDLDRPGATYRYELMDVCKFDELPNI